MEEPNEDSRVVPELYFLIAKFLSGGPLTETAKTLLKELESVEVLPRRLDWQGDEHSQSYNELAAQYSDVPWHRLAAVCASALRLAPSPSTSRLPLAPAPSLRVRLSLLGDALVRTRPKYSAFKKDHTLARRLLSRELGGIIEGRKTAPRAPAAQLLPQRLLGGLQLRRRTLGHLSAVYCLAFDCSGRYVVTGADDLLVKVWSAYDGRLIATLRGAGAEITDVCLSRDGALLACGSVDRLVRVWCLATGAPLAVLHAHAGTITSVHWSPWARGDVRWLASTSTDGSVAFWTCSRDGQFLSQPVQYMERMRPGACHMICAAWSAGGAFLAAGSQDHHVRVYMVDGEGGGPRRVLETAVHSEAVDSLAWAHRGLRFVSGSKDGAACVWALHASAWRHTVLHCAVLETAVHSEAVDSLAWAHRGLRFVSGSKDGAACVWALHASAWRHTVLHCASLDDAGKDDGKKLKVTMVCWDLSDAYIITAVSDCSIRVWCSRTCGMVRVLRGHKDEAYVLEAHPLLPGVLLSAGHDGQLFVWDASTGEILASFLNKIEGQGEGAIFDAKWGGGCALAAADAHGHLLLLSVASGPKLMSKLPPELFFHTDYRPLLRDATGTALDEQTEIPPHLMPPPFLVDVEGAPHPPEYQRLVPGRENLALDQLIPLADARSRIDVMIEALAAERTPGLVNGLGFGGGGVWRNEGVRHTAGSWQRDVPVPPSSRPLVAPPPAAVTARQHQQGSEMNAFELAWYRREMRRRPIMISTAPEPQRRRARPRPRPKPQAQPVRRVVEEPSALEVVSSDNDTSDESVRLSRSHSRSSRSRSHSRSSRSSLDLTDSSSHSGSKSGNSSSSAYSDWEAGAALAPPTRARRRPVAARRYSPSVSAPKRPAATNGAAASGSGSGAAPAPADLPELYRPGEWLTAVSPRKAPYHPQMGDAVVYFRVGHQKYLEAVSEKDLYPVLPRDRPWENAHVYDCEAAKVVGIKYAIKPPRVACVRLACSLPRPVGSSTATGGGSIVVVYHDMPDVIDFLVLRQQYSAGCARGWTQGDRFRCMIDDSWWTGVVLENTSGASGDAGPVPDEPDAAARWARTAAANFLSLKVRWDNGEVERLSPWDLEPMDPERLPSAPGGAVPVLPHELEAVLYKAEASEWPPRGDRAAACRAIAHHLNLVMSLSAAEPFVAPVDLQLYPTYALVVPYPIDLSTIRSRFDHLFYRRAAAAQFDVRYLASNAERFNEPHSPIVRQARLITDLLLYIISHWREVDVVAKYHELAAAYRSEDDEPAPSQPTKSRRARGRAGSISWRAACTRVLQELTGSTDAGPFREPVSLEQVPDYLTIVKNPMDLGTISQKLAAGRYSRPAQVHRDLALVFHNSRLYNTNKRSRIYSMTVRLSALFAALWEAHVPAAAAASASGSATRVTRRARRKRIQSHAESMNGDIVSQPPSPARPDLELNSDSSSSEPLAALAQARLQHPDSSDSDVPLRAHRKGEILPADSRIGDNMNGDIVSQPPSPARPDLELNSDSSSSEPLAALAQARLQHPDSSDSDVPLRAHRKGEILPADSRISDNMNGDIVSQPPSPARPDLELNSDSSSSEPLAALAQARLQHPDSSDSDVPLRAHRKGEILPADSRISDNMNGDIVSQPPSPARPDLELNSDSSSSEPLAALAQARLQHPDSSDSDVPLRPPSPARPDLELNSDSSSSEPLTALAQARLQHPDSSDSDVPLRPPSPARPDLELNSDSSSSDPLAALAQARLQHPDSSDSDVPLRPPSPARPDLELNSDSSSSEPLAALAQARLQHPDSSDSDVPLRAHRKGEILPVDNRTGDGMNGDIVLSSSTEQIEVEQLSIPADDASLTYDDDSPAHEPSPEIEVEQLSIPAGDASLTYDDDSPAHEPSPEIEVEQLSIPADDASLTYDDDSPAHEPSPEIEVEQLSIPADDASLTYDDDSPAREPSPEFRPSARRKRARGSDSAPSPPRRHRHRHRHRHREKLPKRTRERFTDGSSQSSSSNSEHTPERDGQRRYESDHSYHPRCSSDDEPLQRYRERQENDASQGEHSGTSRSRPSHSRRGGVKLRIRRPAVYNEDSEEDSAAAISKRAPHHSRAAPHHQRRRHHAAQSAATEAAMEAGALLLRRSAGGAPAIADHDYLHSTGQPHDHHNGHASSSRAEAPVSISSRGRVRKLTAKARGLLRE
ncbi:bromodomain and WD repeat-containing protein 3 [Cydia splendana]|uniref:bromodomain and WD repeat-containing protein 3 n=1 Tax=Cydia splendana TaxID=1100963 RepID=UPI00300D4629